MKQERDEQYAQWFLKRSDTTTGQLLELLDAEFAEAYAAFPRELVRAIHLRALYNVLNVVEGPGCDDTLVSDGSADVPLGYEARARQGRERLAAFCDEMARWHSAPSAPVKKAKAASGNPPGEKRKYTKRTDVTPTPDSASRETTPSPSPPEEVISIPGIAFGE